MSWVSLVPRPFWKFRKRSGHKTSFGYVNMSYSEYTYTRKGMEKGIIDCCRIVTSFIIDEQWAPWLPVVLAKMKMRAKFPPATTNRIAARAQARQATPTLWRYVYSYHAWWPQCILQLAQILLNNKGATFSQLFQSVIWATRLKIFYLHYLKVRTNTLQVLKTVDNFLWLFGSVTLGSGGIFMSSLQDEWLHFLSMLTLWTVDMTKNIMEDCHTRSSPHTIW